MLEGKYPQELGGRGAGVGHLEGGVVTEEGVCCGWWGGNKEGELGARGRCRWRVGKEG